MLLSKEQLSSVMAKHSERENGLQDLMEIMLESMMVAERREFLDNAEGNKVNYSPFLDNFYTNLS